MSYDRSDKYQVIRTIYESAATRVVLIRAKQSDELRIMKIIHKDAAASEPFLFEASLLRELDHPGIPRLYETIEDEDYFYLIEEYVWGDSLDEYLLYHQHISQDTFLQIALQLCGIVTYLHSHDPEPILYLDMKPSHIIVCENQMKLIDYGIAKFLTSSGNNFQKYGTKKYAAPEQLQGESLDERADVYGVGRMLWLMLWYLQPRDVIRFWPVVRKAIRKDRGRRTGSIRLLTQQLQQTKRRAGKQKKNKKHLLQKIAVIGSETGVGCTHVAIALVCYLNQAGFCAYYRNETGQPVLERMVQHDMACIHEDGIIYHESFQGYMTYGPAVAEGEPPKGIQIVDCGCGRSDDADAAIYVCSGSVWQQVSGVPAWVSEEHAIIVCNHSTRFQAGKCAREWNHRVYFFPYQNNAFHVTAAVRILFSNMVERELICEKQKKKVTIS